jgi:hypothetical protein
MQAPGMALAFGGLTFLMNKVRSAASDRSLLARSCVCVCVCLCVCLFVVRRNTGHAVPCWIAAAPAASLGFVGLGTLSKRNLVCQQADCRVQSMSRIKQALCFATATTMSPPYPALQFTGGTNPELGGVAPDEKEAKFSQSEMLLRSLGFEKYHKNIKGGQLTDDTILLWTEQSLADCRIPPGPRCVPFRQCCNLFCFVLVQLHTACV